MVRSVRKFRDSVHTSAFISSVILDDLPSSKVLLSGIQAHDQVMQRPIASRNHMSLVKRTALLGQDLRKNEGNLCRVVQNRNHKSG